MAVIPRLSYHAAGRLAGVLLPLPTVSLRKDSFADRQSTRAQGPQGREGEDEDTRSRRRAAEARRVHARHDADAEEAEFGAAQGRTRSEEHTSELQSPCNLVCRLLLEKKKNV